MKRYARVIAAALVVALVCFGLFSALLINEKAAHECCGEGCSVCREINTCRNTIESLFAVVCVFVCASLCARRSGVRSDLGEASARLFTLVTSGVKLSD